MYSFAYEVRVNLLKYSFVLRPASRICPADALGYSPGSS
jgi:hypothetical protein